MIFIGRKDESKEILVKTHVVEKVLEWFGTNGLRTRSHLVVAAGEIDGPF